MVTILIDYSPSCSFFVISIKHILSWSQGLNYNYKVKNIFKF